jgi:hypothetical protein
MVPSFAKNVKTVDSPNKWSSAYHQEGEETKVKIWMGEENM